MRSDADVDFDLCVAHAEVRRGWEPSSPRAADLIVRFAARLEALGVARLNDDELAMAVDAIGRFDPPAGPGSAYSRALAAFQRRAIVREWLADPTSMLGEARAILRDGGVGQENCEANVPAGSALVLALADAERMHTDELFELLDPLISTCADRIPAPALRCVARAICRELNVELPTTAKQQRRLVSDWVHARRCKRAQADGSSAARVPEAARAAVPHASLAAFDAATAFSIDAALAGDAAARGRRGLPARLARRLEPSRARATPAARGLVRSSASAPAGGSAPRSATAFVISVDGTLSELVSLDGARGARPAAPARDADARAPARRADEPVEAVARAGAPPRDECAPIRAIDGDVLSALLVYPGVALSHVEWRSFGALGALNRAWRAWRAQESVWHVMCVALARGAQLYCPPLVAPPSAEARVLAAAASGGGRWARVWWEALYPARNAWRAAAARAAGDEPGAHAGVVARFKIDVAVRLKPGPRDVDAKLLLPLHQRLRLRAKGELLTADNAQLSIERLREAGLLAPGAQLPPDVVAALAEARALDLCAASATAAELRARARAAGGAPHELDGVDGAGGAPEPLGEGVPAAGGADGAAGGGGMAAAGAGAEDGAAAEGARDTVAADSAGADGASGARASRGAGARVLLVQPPSRVLMFYPGVGLRPFEFSRVFDGAETQAAVYESTARVAVAAALNGLNACLLLYGQTGSGKTHTAFGPAGVLEMGALDRAAEVVAERARTGRSFAPPDEWGIALRACAELLAEATAPTVRGVRTSVAVQYVQVYADRVYDLLGDRRVVLRAGDDADGGVQLVGADERVCASLSELLRLLALGESRKRYRATNMNERSSRAHTLLMLHVTRTNAHARTLTRSHLHVVDLAGSEQLKLSGAHGVSQKEAVAINSSLLCLGKVVSALLGERSHVPYRESALTLLLRASLGGSSRTTCVVTAPLCDAHAEQTYHSLSFGERCSLVTNSASLRVGSLAEALGAIDDALARCEASVAALEARGLGGSDGARKLRERSAELVQKRSGMAARAAPDESEPRAA